MGTSYMISSQSTPAANACTQIYAYALYGRKINYVYKIYEDESADPCIRGVEEIPG